MATLALAWSNDNNGGYMAPTNPQARLSLKQPGDVRLRMELGDDLTTGIIMAVVRGDKRLTAVPASDAIVTKSKYYVSGSITITPTLPAGDYVVLCCDGKAQGPESFRKMTLSASQGALEPLDFLGASKSHTVRMEGEGSAGYGNPKNPQFFITVTKATPLTVAVSLLEDNEKDAVAYFVQRTKTAGERLDTWGNEQTRVFTSKFVGGGHVSSAIGTVEPGVYAVLVMKNTTSPSTVRLTATAAEDKDIVVTGAVHVTPQHVSRRFESEAAAKRGTVEFSGLTFDAYSVKDARALVDTLTRKLKDGEVFEDDRFGGDETHLNNVAKEPKKLNPVDWSRPSDLSSRPCLFSDGIDANDVAQGSLGNCWFCATVASVGGLRPQAISSLFYPAAYNAKGVYAVTLHIDGTTKALVIDDRLPTRGGALAFARSGDGSEFWFSLLEKTFAKVAGGYQGLMGRCSQLSTLRVITALTGATATSLKIDDGAADTAAQFAQVCEYTAKHWLVTTSTREGRDSTTGLVAAHAYTVLSAIETGGFRLVKVRNTWGRSEWKGDWSDTSDLWVKHPAVAKACGVDVSNPADDGVFWMSWTDFAEHYGTLNFGKFVEDELPHSAETKGTWTSDAHCSFHRLAEHTQHYVTLDASGAVLSMVLRAGSNAARFKIFRAPPGTECLTVTQAEELFASRYRQNPVAELTLPADCDRVIVVASVAKVEGGPKDYTLHINSSAAAKLAVARKPTAAAASLAVVPATKYRNKLSPHCKLSVPASATCTLTATLGDGLPKQGIQLCVGPVMDEWPKDGVKIAESKFVLSTKVTLDVELAAGDYSVWVALQKTDQSGTVQLNALSPVKVSLGG